MIKFLLNRPIAVIMSVLALCVLGVVSALKLPVSLMPDIDIPEITVSYTRDNVSVREMENSITSEIRNQLQQTPNLTEITTESYEGGGKITMRFSYGTDIDYAFIEVNENIDAAMKYMPQDMARPSIIKASTSDIPVFQIYITPKNNFTEQDFLEFCEFAESVLKKRLEQLPDVAIVDISGYYEPELYILPNYTKLQSLGITQEELANAIDKNNRIAGSLMVRDGYFQYNVKFTSQLSSTEEIEDVYLNVDGRVLQLKDIAEVGIRPRDKRGVFLNGNRQSLCLSVIKQSDARMSDMTENITAMLDNFRTDYPEIDFTVSRDQAELLNYSIDNLVDSLTIGIILAIGIMFFFLKDPRSPIIIALSIPISVIITMLIFKLINMSINTISLAGLIMGVGMMVDNAIIVIDNITQYRERGHKLFEACNLGTLEIIRPLISSVLTTCAVFIPLIFLGDISGALFYDEAMAVTAGLLVSLVISITFIPVLYHLILGKWNTSKITIKGFEDKDLEALYTKGYNFVFSNRKRTWLIIGIFVAVGVVAMFTSKIEQMPPVETSDKLVKIDWNSSIHIDENQNRVNSIINKFAPQCEEISAHVGEKQFFLNNDEKQHINQVELYIKSQNIDKLNSSVAELERYIRTEYPEATFKSAKVENLFEQMFKSNNAPLILHLSSQNGTIPELKQVNSYIDSIANRFGQPDINRPTTEERMVIHLRPDVMALYGVSQNALIATLEKEINKTSIGKLNTGNRYIPLVVTSNEETIYEIVKKSSVASDKTDEYGRISYVPVSNLIEIGNEADYKTITGRKEGSVIPIVITDDKIANQDLIQYATLLAKDMEMEVNLSGDIISGNETIADMTLIIIIAIFMLYFIMAAQFESLKMPLIVLIEIPIDICFTLAIMKLVGTSINLMSMIGFVVICGVVINDSILKIDTIIKLEKQGMSTLEAIHEGGVRRLKPILMTSLTSIFAMIPMLWGDDIGTQLQYPLAVTIIAGMTIGTCVSIFFVPLCYYLTRTIGRKH